MLLIGVGANVKIFFRLLTRVAVALIILGMERDSDIGEWIEAIRLEADGESPMLVDRLVALAPLPIQESLRSRLKQRLRKPPSAATVKLANAVAYFLDREQSMPFDALVKDTCAKFRIKKPSILINAIGDSREDVNMVLRKMGRKPAR